MSEIVSTIEQILDMQRRGTKDYDQAAKLLETYYNRLDEGDRAQFFPVLEAILLGERLPPVNTSNKFPIHGSIIKAWARFGAPDRLIPIVLGLRKFEPEIMERWAAWIAPVLNSALSDYADHFSKASLERLAQDSAMIIGEEKTGLVGKAFPKSIIDTAARFQNTLKNIEGVQLERRLVTLGESRLTSYVPHQEGAVEWDVFIVHASADKEEFVAPLAHALEQRGLRVWYDQFKLRVGHSLRQRIDEGLTKSRFGVVILSHAFFNKEWPQKELDGLFSREIGGKSLILPVWHNLTYEDVLRYSPLLASRLAVSSGRGVRYVVEQILEAIEAAD